MSVTLHSGLLGVSSQTRRVGFSPTQADERGEVFGIAERDLEAEVRRLVLQPMAQSPIHPPRRDDPRAGREAEEQRDRRRHARAEHQRRGGAFERTDQRFGLARGLIVGPAVDRPAPVGVGRIADEGRRHVQRRHQALRRLVDAAERLGGARALAPVLRAAHSVSPRNSRGALTPSPAASAASRRFSGDNRSTTRKPKSRAKRKRREIVGEQAVQRVHAEARRHDVEAAGALVGLQRRRVARIEAEPHALDNCFSQSCDVAQAEVEPLPRQRMNDMGGVGDQRQPFGDEAPREAERERNGFDARSEAERAELQA